MRQKRTWLILGAAEGLGPAAVKYLSAHGQQVMLLDSEDLPPGLRGYEHIHYIINNSNYRLFHEALPDIHAAAGATVSRLSALTALLSQDPPGTIINVPPQLCLATLDDPAAGPELLRQMNLFLELLKEGLKGLGYPLRLIEPGERLFAPSYI